MNLPNKLTVLRVLMIPLFLFLALMDSIPYNTFWALLVFAVASATDALDGHIARKNNLVTNFGKFLDPLADKILVMAALVCFIELGYVGSVPVILILAREFTVTALRLVASSEVVIAAGILGKLKTAFTMIAVIFIFLMHGLAGAGVNLGGYSLYAGDQVAIWIAAALTVISGVQYLWEYRHFINTTK